MSEHDRQHSDIIASEMVRDLRKLDEKVVNLGAEQRVLTVSMGTLRDDVHLLKRALMGDGTNGGLLSRMTAIEQLGAWVKGLVFLVAAEILALLFVLFKDRIIQ